MPFFFFLTPQPVSTVHSYRTTPVGRISFSRRVFICKLRFSYGMRRRADIPHFRTFSSFLFYFLLLLSLPLLLLQQLMIHSLKKVETLESSARYSYWTIPTTTSIWVCLSLNTVPQKGVYGCHMGQMRQTESSKIYKYTYILHLCPLNTGSTAICSIQLLKGLFVTI